MTRDSCGSLTAGSYVCTSPKALLRYLRSLHCRRLPRISYAQAAATATCILVAVVTQRSWELGSQWAKGQGPHPAGFGGLSLEQCWFWLRQLQWGKPREPAGVEQRRGKLQKAAKRRMKRPGTQRAPPPRGGVEVQMPGDAGAWPGTGVRPRSHSAIPATCTGQALTPCCQT